MHQIYFLATRAVFNLLAQVAAGLVEEAGCKFSLSPCGAGQTYFERGAPGAAGLYLHRQPCISGVSIFPLQRGLGWLCFANAFEGVPETERDHDPSFIVIEGNAEALKYLQKIFAQMSESKELVFSADEVRLAFGGGSGFSLHMVQREESDGRQAVHRLGGP